MREERKKDAAGRPVSSREEAVRGWKRPLAAAVSALLLIEGISGLWLYLAGFSVFGQLLILAHTVLGLVLLFLYPSYQWQHIVAWIRQRMTASMKLGFGLLVTTVVCIVSGVVVTWQAAFSIRVTYLWDQVHSISGFAVLALLAAHIISALVRRRLAARADLELKTAMSSFGRRNALALAGATALVATVALFWPKIELRMPIPEDYSLPTYAQEFEEYRGNPFAPTYARTDDLQLVRPELLAGSRSCGTANCHQQILAEWESSAHRFAAMNPPFQEVQRGNADYVLTPPRKYLGEGDEGASKWLSDFLIRSYPRQHLADYDRNLLRTPEYCGACHKQFIPEALNRFGLVEGQNQYDEWKNSYWTSDVPEMTAPTAITASSPPTTSCLPCSPSGGRSTPTPAASRTDPDSSTRSAIRETAAPWCSKRYRSTLRATSCASTSCGARLAARANG